MPISKITYAKLFNLGNYENERFEVEVTIEDGSDPAAIVVAWASAVGEVEQQHARLEAERKEAQRKAREEYEQRERERREQWRIEQERRRAQWEAEESEDDEGEGGDDDDTGALDDSSDPTV